MYFQQIMYDDLGCASYIVGGDTGCAVVDPQWDSAPYLATARQKGLTITHIIETHVHADHVSGGRRLAAATGAMICLPAGVEAAYPFQPLHDGDVLDVSDLKLLIVETPGHTAAHISVVVEDLTRAAEPWFVLTGDALFIGDAGRPDLILRDQAATLQANRLAAHLHHSLFERLLHLDDGVEVYPGHVAGSLCGRAMSSKASSTIGFERRYNVALTPRTVAEFAEFMTVGLPPKPANYETVKRINLGLTPDVDVDPDALPALDPAGVERAVAAGAAVLDVRGPAPFAAGHLPGAFGVALTNGQFGTRVGMLAAPGTPLVLVVETAEERRRATIALAAVGFRTVGYLEGGVDAWVAAGRPVEALPELDVADLARRLEVGSPPLQLVDVRDPGEWDVDHVPVARHIRLGELAARLGEIRREQPVAVMCAGGLRSVAAASLLARAGYQVYNVPGGFSGWARAGLPTAAQAPTPVGAGA